MSTPELFTHLELATLLGVSVTTVKSYRRKFPGCIPVASQGKPIRFTGQARDVCLRIRDLFATGMSVPEVRARLAGEFAWIPPDAPSKKADPGLQIELPPLYTSAMSDMAQSLVGLAQKQGTVLTRLEALGSALGTGQPAPDQSAPDQSASAQSGAGQPSGVCEPAVFAPIESPAPPAPAAPLNRAETERPAWLDEFAALSRQAAELVLRLESCTDRLDLIMEGLPSSPPSGSARGITQETTAGAFRQPDRAFMGLPLVAAGSDGLLRGIAGPGRGRFTCTDIKALAACPTAPDRACSLEWAEHGADWRLTLRGRGGKPLAMALLREVSDNAGNTAVLLHQARVQGEESDSTDFLAFLRDLAQ